jgi:alkaline phosphatase D
VISDELEVVTRDPVNGEELTKEIDSRYVNGDPSKEIGQELDVEETIIVERKDPEILKTLLTGLPSPSSLLWSGITFAINLALLAMVWDVVYTAPKFYPSHDLSMVRVGYVSDSTAKILVREPDASRLPIFISYRHADPPFSRGDDPVPFDTAWKSGGSIKSLDDSTDFTGILNLRGLVSDTRYQYVANNQTGYFTTAPKVGETSNRLAMTGAFTFLATSCLKNRLPYSPFEHPLSNQGLRYLSQSIGALKAQFMLFLGDFIYVDVPRRQGTSVADYRREYRQLYSSPDWPAASRDLPWIHVYDDHEIANDWDGNTTSIFAAANDPYQHYHVAANPPAARAGESYFSFTQGPATFFMLDTRRYRSTNDHTNGSDPITGDPTKTLLGAQQLADLLAWLKRSEPEGVRWKILASSVPFTKNWWMNAQDTWRGYLGERQIILEAMWDVGLRGGVGVIILSGDRHEFAATAFPPPPEGKEEIVGLGPIGVGVNPLGINQAVMSPDAKSALRTKRKRWPLSSTVHEFSASPLNMFYLPFRTYRESSTSPDYISDVCIKYIPDGNSKFGAITISNPPTSDQSVLHYRLFVDGSEKWSYTLTTPPDVAGGARAKDAIVSILLDFTPNETFTNSTKHL